MNNLIELKEIAKDITLLYVEDEDILRESVSKYLSKFFKNIDTASNGAEGLELYKKNKYDLVITDILMPKLNGIDMSTKIKEINSNQNILIISAYSDTKDFIASIKIGIDGYIIKPIDYEQLNSTLYKIADKINNYKENLKYKNNLEDLVDKKTKDVKELEEEKVRNYKKTLLALVQMIEERDPYTGGHSLRVAEYSKRIASEFGLDDKKSENIYQAGVLHDIGKVAIPDNVLLKPGSLDNLEYKIIQDHVSIGVDMLNQIPLFDELISFIEGHHERLDGSGYPKGLKGDEISNESQILAVSDIFDAMTTSRIYKARKTIAQALEEIKSLSNIHFREDIVDAAVKALKDINISENITQLPTTDIEKERFSYFYKDQITQSYNSSYLDLVLTKNSFDIQYKYINLISIHNLNNINDKFGWEEGDKYLKDVSINLQDIYVDSLVFRVYSDDFLILSTKEVIINKTKLEEFICRDEINFEVKKYNIEKDKTFSFHSLELLR